MIGSDKENYKLFIKKHPLTEIDFDTWKEIIYKFNYGFRDAIFLRKW